MKKILLADDHDLFRDGLRHLLKDMMECSILEANDYDIINECCSKHCDIDLLLIDLDMPGSDGLNGILRLRKALPEAAIIVISCMESADIVSVLLDAGVQGYIPKSSSSLIMKKAIELVISGGIYIPPVTLSLLKKSGITDTANINLDTNTFSEKAAFTLTKREHEVLRLLVKGNANKEIAKSLGISATTVRTHTVSIFRTLNVSNRTQAGHVAVKSGLV